MQNRDILDPLSDLPDEDPVSEPAEAQPASAHQPQESEESVERLRGQAQRDLRLQKQLALLVAGSVAGFLLLVYLPSSSDLARLRSEITQGARQLMEDRRRTTLLPQVRDAADRLEQQLSHLKPLAEQQNFSGFMREVNYAAARYDLQQTLKCVPAEATQADGLETLPVRLTFSGDFLNVFRFLRHIEQLPRLLGVREIALRPQVDEKQKLLQPGAVQVDLTLNLYYRAASQAG